MANLGARRLAAQAGGCELGFARLLSLLEGGEICSRITSTLCKVLSRTCGYLRILLDQVKSPGTWTSEYFKKLKVFGGPKCGDCGE
jgi:hypothetical protein